MDCERRSTVVAALLVAALLPAAVEASRQLLQTACDIAHCAADACISGDASSPPTCGACEAGYRPGADGRACECMPGYYAPAPGGACEPCGEGAWCAGGAAPRVECGAGMTTKLLTAARQRQCVSEPGHSGVDGSLCPVGTWSAGSCRKPCKPCGGGLTTLEAGAVSRAACAAPPGHYLAASGAAADCPAGTYNDVPSQAAACKPCPAGLTTFGSGSVTAGACSWAKAGFFVAGADKAAPCAANSYADARHQADACTPCPAGRVTAGPGATSADACVAPAGVDGVTGAPCAPGTYKSGLGNGACTPCFLGAAAASVATTAGPGATSAAECFIPAGYGTNACTESDGVELVACVSGSYGEASATHNVRDLPCSACPEGTTSSTTPGANTGEAACVLLPGWGFDGASGEPVRCPAGTWSAGGGRGGCTPCGDGYSTPAPGATSAAECAVGAGYGLDASGRLELCPAGTWSAGGAGAKCQDCPAGTTSIKEGGASIAACDRCAAGYGGHNGDAVAPACALCAPGTYSPEGSPECMACATRGDTSPSGATSGDDCYSPWAGLVAGQDALWTAALAAAPASEIADAAACKAACTGDCMYYMWDIKAGACLRARAAGAAAAGRIGFKGEDGHYTVYAWDAAVEVGDAAGSPAAASGAECAAACDKAGDACIAAVWAAGRCQLRRATPHPAISVMEYRVDGARFDAWAA